MNQKQPDQHTFEPPLPPEEPVFQNPEDILGATISKQKAETQIHKEITTFDSGAQIPSLSSAIYISLDTFHNVVHNINTELDAWLEFLSTDDPAGIVRLVNAYPQFLSCYQDIKEFRKKPGELIYMYSEALAILDRNTEIYMCEELKKENAALKKELDDLRCAVSENKTILSEIKTALSEKETALSEKETALLEKETALLKKETALSEKETALSEIKTVLQQKDKEIALLRQKFEDASQ